MNLVKITHEDAHKIIPLIKPLRFDNLLEALINGFHGEMFVDNKEKPTLFLAYIGWNYYLAGDAQSEHAIEIIKQIPPDTEIHTSEDWVNLLSSVYPNQFVRKTRYAHSSKHLDKKHLNNIINKLNPRYNIVPIDEMLYHQILKDEWGKDFVINFKNYQDFKDNGLGFVVLDGDKVISGTSSYIRYNKGYEIEIITHKDCRNQGLAEIIGAYFTLDCLNKNKGPHWDAAHPSSKRLAQRIGFTFTYEYEVYIIKGKS